MKAIITNDKLKIQDNTLYNSGSIQYYEIDVEFSSDWDNLTKYAVLVGAEKIKLPVVANKLHVDQRASGTYTIGFVGYTLEDDEKVYQISTNLECIYFQTGAGEIEANEPSDLPDPTTWETYLSEIQTIVDGAENVNITAEKVGDTTHITTTDKTGTTETVEVLDGKDAKINGVNTLTVEGGANVSIEQEGSTLIISATDTTDYTELSNKPSINGVELGGNKTSADLNIKQTYNKTDVGLGNVDNIRQYSDNNPPPYPVTSVNGQTGAVVIDTHDDLIPTQASSSNQLADKNFVNSTVGTATATFRGTYNSLAELEQVSADENDYGFVVGTDSAGNTVYNRYKYASGTWVFEYALNNSSFTQAQWEAIQSGITSALVTKLQGIENNAEVNKVEGLKIGNTTQEIDNKIIEITPDTTPVEDSTNVIDSNAVYEIENMLPTDTTTGDIDNAQPYKVLDIVADGKYQQDTTEGNNIFHFESKTEDGWYTDIPNMITETGTYTLSINDNSLTGNWAVYFVDNNKTRVGDFIKSQSAVATPSTFSVSQEQVNAPYIRILPNASGLHDIENYKFQINTGSTAKPYEPYTGGIPSPNPNYPQTITQVTSATWNRVGKNLFDINNAYHGTINASGFVGPNENFRTSDYIPTKPNIEYYFSTTQRTGQTDKQIYIAYYDKAKTFLSRDSYNELSHSFTTPPTCYYMRAGVFTLNQENVMLEQGSTATSYSAYQGQSIPIDLDGNEVCSVGTIKDKVLVDRYGNVALQKNVGKKVLNGSEIGIRNTYTNIDYATIQKPSDFLGYNTWDTTTIICSSATYLSVTQGTWDTANNVGKISGNATEKHWWIGFTKGTAQATMQTTLNNSIIYYPFATPQIIPLPKLSILPSTLKGINHIWLDTNLGITDIEVEYVEDLSLAIPTKTSELTNDSGYVKNTDYAAESKVGVIKSSYYYGTQVNNTGILMGSTRTYQQYTSGDNSTIVAKGTLENVLTERIGTIETALTTLDVGGGVQ